MAIQRIQLKRGNKANLPTTGMLPGEAMVTLDQGTLHIATDATTKLPVVPALDDLATMGAVTATDDLMLIWDADTAAGIPKAKKLTVTALRQAMNIPDASTDEKTAAVDGGSSGSLFGTDGTNGVLRLGSSMGVTLDAGSAFATIEVAVIDGGTF